MPFGFRRPKKESSAAPAPGRKEPPAASSTAASATSATAAAAAMAASRDTAPRPPTIAPGVPFDGVTEDWRLVGRMLVEGRLSDALNNREPIALADMQWAPVDGSEPLTPAPGLKSLDPYDLVLVIAGEEALPVRSAETNSANSVSHEVGLEVPPYRVVGTVMLAPGHEPTRLMDRSSDMFVPVANATATMEGRTVSPPRTEVILVNRAYLRGVEAIDARTGERPAMLPG